MPKVKLTPLIDTVVDNAIGVVPSYHDAILRKLDWPTKPNRRAAEGGSGGEFFDETIKIKWNHDKLYLTLPNQKDINIEIGSKDGSNITFDGPLIAQLDADVAYFPEKHLIPLHSKEFIMFVCVEATATKEKMFRAVKIPHGYGVVIEAFVPHSAPIPLLDNSVEFKVYHRSANSVAQFKLSEPLTVDIEEPADESTTIKIIKLVDTIEENTSIKLPNDFSSEKLKIEPVNRRNFSTFGLLIEDYENYKEEITHVPWPCIYNLQSFPGLEPISQDSTSSACQIGELIQDFKMTWVPHSVEVHKKTIQFHGLGGSFIGAEGKPGVEFDPTTGEYTINVLQARPDSSFYIRPRAKTHKFIMIFAKPDSETGEPLKDSLKAFVFDYGQGARLPPNTWHSVPIPLAIDDHVIFHEIIAETNANLIANVQFESDGPLVANF